VAYFSQSQNTIFADVVNVQFQEWQWERAAFPTVFRIRIEHLPFTLDGWILASLTKFPVIHHFSSFAAHHYSTYLVTTAFVFCSLKKRRPYHHLRKF